MSGLASGLLNFYIAILNIITAPIQAFINAYCPNINDFFSNIAPFFNLFGSDVIPYLKDFVFIPTWAWILVVNYFIFKFTCIIFSNVTKLVIEWWHYLVP